MNQIISHCVICNEPFTHPKRKHRILCSKECTAIYMSELYKGKYTGKDNPNYGNGQANKAAHLRGCYSHRKIPDHTRGKGEYYKGIWLRSSWEIAYAEFLDDKSIEWKYECARFRLSDGRYYTPDFYLIKEQKFIEIKGHWYSKAKQKFEQFLLEYPDVKIEVISEEIWKL